MMEQDRIIGPGQGAKPREILVGPEYLARGASDLRAIHSLLMLAVATRARGRAPATGRAQELDQVVAGVEATYGKITDLRAEFSQVAHNKSLGQDIKAEGTVYLKKGGKMRWDYKSPSPQQIVSDGTSLWVYTPELNQVNKGERAEGAGRPRGQLPRRPRARARRVHRALPEPGAARRTPPAAPCWTSTPKAPTPLLTRLVLSVDPKDYVVRQAVLYDQLQNTVTMTFTQGHAQRGPAGLALRLHAARRRRGGPARSAEPRRGRAGQMAMAAENSFDIACKLDMQEVANAINQAQREIETRYDLKGTKNEIKQEKMVITLTSADDMKLKAVLDILQSKLHRRGIDLKALTIGDPESAAGGTVRQTITPAGRRAAGEGQGDRAPHQGQQDPGAGLDPGEPGARLRQEPGRPAGHHRPGQGQGPGDRAAVHELPLDIASGAAPPPAIRVFGGLSG